MRYSKHKDVRTPRIPRFEQALTRSPAVAILGPRQVGKTTLARFWQACADTEVSEAWVVAPVREAWPIGERAQVMSPLEMPIEALST